MYEEIVSLIEMNRVAFPKYGNGLSQKYIDLTEKSLGFPLPKSYKWWLLNFGGGQILDDILYGIDDDGMGKPDVTELAHMNTRDGLYEED